jgi:hypothetical protein
MVALVESLFALLVCGALLQAAKANKTTPFKNHFFSSILFCFLV